MNNHNNGISKTVKKTSAAYTGLEAFTNDLVPATKVNCVFCKSKYKEEAEQLYVKNANISSIIGFFHQKGEGITAQCIKNHLMRHFTEEDRNNQIRDYGQEISQWAKLQPAPEQRLRIHITALERLIHVIGASCEEDNHDELRKDATLIVKLTEQSMKLQQELEKVQGDMKPIQVFMEKFATKVSEYIKNSPNEECKDYLFKFVNDLQKDMEDTVFG